MKKWHSTSPNERDFDESSNEAQEYQQNQEQRIEQLHAKAEKIEHFLADNKPKLKCRHGEAQSNITDNESAKMKTGHGVIQGYNGLALVDAKHQIVVHAEAFGSGPEHDLLQPMLSGNIRLHRPPGGAVNTETLYAIDGDEVR